MSGRSFECFPDEALALGAAGDVLGARQLARAVLATAPHSPANSTLAAMILTAACLHADSVAPGEPDARDLAAVLRDLISEKTPLRPMNSSRVQFSAYAAAELQLLTAEAQTDLVDELIRLVIAASGATP